MMMAAPNIALMSAFPYHPPGEARALHWLKADLHLHTAEDPCDEVDYSALELVERAHREGFRVLAITLHDEVFEDQRVFDRARELGVLLIPAVERRIEGADVVLLNISREEADALGTFEDLRRLRRARGGSLLSFAPHPYYVLGGSIGSRIEGYMDCFDAIEHCHFHVPLVNPNRPARRLAHRHNKPLVATSDCHRKPFFGQNYSYLGLLAGADGEIPSAQSVFDAIRAHRVQRVAPSGGIQRLAALLWFIFVLHPLLARRTGSKRNARTLRRVAVEPLGFPAGGESAMI